MYFISFGYYGLDFYFILLFISTSTGGQQQQMGVLLGASWLCILLTILPQQSCLLVTLLGLLKIHICLRVWKHNISSCQQTTCLLCEPIFGVRRVGARNMLFDYYYHYYYYYYYYIGLIKSESRLNYIQQVTWQFGLLLLFLICTSISLRGISVTRVSTIQLVNDVLEGAGAPDLLSLSHTCPYVLEGNSQS